MENVENWITPIMNTRVCSGIKLKAECCGAYLSPNYLSAAGSLEYDIVSTTHVYYIDGMI